jgi:hypothetical protein
MCRSISHCKVGFHKKFPSTSFSQQLSTAVNYSHVSIGNLFFLDSVSWYLTDSVNYWYSISRPSTLWIHIIQLPLHFLYTFQLQLFFIMGAFSNKTNTKNSKVLLSHKLAGTWVCVNLGCTKAKCVQPKLTHDSQLNVEVFVYTTKANSCLPQCCKHAKNGIQVW